MSVDKEILRYRILRIGVFFLVGVTSFLGLKAQDSAIVLGPIEGELAKKQIPIDLGRTPKVLLPLISKPIYIHTHND